MANTSVHPVLKISGYLEKKAKMRIGSPWKKYWFVLEARLLLYYRSKDEYETLSPCKGSINLCPPCNVRPALSAACVFQIECRASTITLRAENRQEQDRWMQAILTSIAHSKFSTSRMSHFRYSLDDLPKSSADDKARLEKPLSRQNTMPHRISSSPKSETKGTIIERLQNIGAQTYGGSLSTIAKLANKDIEKTTNDTKNYVVLEERSDQENGNEDVLFINSLQHSSDKVYSVFVENEHYSIIQEENSMELRLDEETNKLEKSSDNQSILTDNQASTENDSKGRSSFILENDQYIYSEESTKLNIRDQEAKTIEHFYERISTDSSLLEYTKTNKQETQHQNGIANIMGQGHEYSVPIMDSNENRLSVENDQYIRTVDNKSNDDGLIYTMEYMEYAAIDKTRELEELYEDPDYLKRQRSEYHDMEPILPPRPDGPKVGTDETSSQTSSNEGRKSKPRFKLLSQFMKFDKKPDDKTKPKRRKNSFLHKVWKRKTKSLDSENDITYDTVDYEIIEKQITKDKKDLEMLQELQKILETRKTMLQVKLNGNEKKTGKLKPITDSAKQSLENKIENSMENQIDTTSKKRPSLPPRQSSHTLLQQFNTVINSVDHQTNQSTTPIIKDTDIDSKKNGLTKNIKTIDQILKDLDKEKDIQESRQKVKQLIDKFNDIHNEDEVILRRKLKSDSNSYKDIKLISPSNQNSTRESDELSMLLEQLSKVTSAPVLTPGATSSLVNPILTEEEWLTLIPIRRRRLSEPDYDVPRPHRSLQLHNPMKQIQENPIPITRFFGPVLPPSSADDNGITTTKSIISLDPDSLELENLPDIVKNNEDSDYSTVDKNYSVGSYTSHDYSNNNKIIYAQPKPIIVNPKINNKLTFSTFNYKKTTNQPIETNRDDFIIIKSEEVFADSLEPHVEISTTF